MSQNMSSKYICTCVCVCVCVCVCGWYIYVLETCRMDFQNACVLGGGGGGLHFYGCINCVV